MLGTPSRTRKKTNTQKVLHSLTTVLDTVFKCRELTRNLTVTTSETIVTHLRLEAGEF